MTVYIVVKNYDNHNEPFDVIDKVFDSEEKAKQYVSDNQDTECIQKYSIDYSEYVVE